MMDLQAAIGIQQFYNFDKNQKRRKQIWKIYNNAFKDLPVKIPIEPTKDMEHAYHLYTILIDTDKVKASREIIQNALHAENIGVGIHFISLHLHPYYKNKYGYKKGDFPVSEYISHRTISLPFSAKLTNRDIDDVIRSVTKIIRYYAQNKPKYKKIKLPIAST